MQPRLQRLEDVLHDPLFESILWGHEYDLSGLDDGLRNRIESGQFSKIAFYGMGCSSVVSDIVKGFFIAKEIPVHVEVINDYDFNWFTSSSELSDDATLTIIVCYSGWSVEPCLFFEAMRKMTGNRNLVVLSGGGKISELAKQNGTSFIQYKLHHADREYPLYHVQQFFAIFLDLFHHLGITPSSYTSELEDAVRFLKQEFGQETLGRAAEIAERLRGSRIALLSTADWYVTLLKQTTMFFNEIAMVPTHRNLLHEFTHTEVAAYSDPDAKQAIVVLSDPHSADDYTTGKIRTLEGLFADKSVPQNRNIEFVTIDLPPGDFFRKFFFGHFFTVYIAYYLGRNSDVAGRDLISIAAKNPWWSQRSIERYPKCVDIPSALETEYATPVSAG